jgi:spore coat protein U-like protein
MRLASFAIACGLLASGLASVPALAATSTTSFAVTAMVQSGCLASTPVAAFGSDPTVARSPAAVTCTSPTQYNVSLTARSSVEADSEMADPGKILLNNALLSAPLHTTERVLKAGARTMAGIGNRYSPARTFNSRTVQAMHVSPGAFADAITVTITY